jgi:hypothetical protein
VFDPVFAVSSFIQLQPLCRDLRNEVKAAAVQYHQQQQLAS